MALFVIHMAVSESAVLSTGEVTPFVDPSDVEIQMNWSVNGALLEPRNSCSGNFDAHFIPQHSHSTIYLRTAECPRMSASASLFLVQNCC